MICHPVFIYIYLHTAAQRFGNWGCAVIYIMPIKWQ